ncbi:hypothetical protein EIP86_001736 [Pleurotus ostreatoroseus]|nr:hypothetical protein EIP86_001736 [Pleurotus ostreatoroseus]
MEGPEGEAEREAVNFSFIEARLQTTSADGDISRDARTSARNIAYENRTLRSTVELESDQQSIRRYGVSDDTKALLVVRIDRPIPDMQYKMLAVVEGDLSPMNDLAGITDWASIKKTWRSIGCSQARVGIRGISSTPRRQTQLPDNGKDRAAVGVFTPKAAALFVATGVGLFFYFRYEKQKLIEQRQKELEDKQIGRPKVGGPFSLTTHQGKTFTEQDLLGKWSLIYFGFTNCPDICPEELDKMGEAVEELDKVYGPIVQPIFISVDPARDSVEQVSKYVADFHPRMVGLTGDYQTVKATCKAYRVYFSTPPNAKADDDYLVDHSIFFYFMDPNGQFVDAFGKSSEVADVVARVQKEITAWQARTGKTV